MNNALQDNPGVIAPPPLIYAGPLAIGLLLSRVFPVTTPPGSSQGFYGLVTDAL
jgi:hypothetical protein